MKVTLIGGSGFIGTTLARQLVDAHEVRIIDIRPSVSFPGLVSHADVRDCDSLLRELRETEAVYLLAAEHADDVLPVSRYYEVNVDGARNVARCAAELGIKRIIFTSSVAVYGFRDFEVDEQTSPAPENHYGKSKLLAEHELIKWSSEDPSRELKIVRPCVVFGPGNRGNVYRLLRTLCESRPRLIGDGAARKSMACVENVAAFLKYCLENPARIPTVCNYTDRPNLSMRELAAAVAEFSGFKGSIQQIPYPLAFLAGTAFDLISQISGKKFALSRERVRKICTPTCFSSDMAENTGFERKVTLLDGLRETIDREFGENAQAIPLTSHG